ncbi:MAG TPA: DUF4147 domain-containing protein [Acidimicrobiia bacterium]|nr:DUF4147 domain-containing protein [Acidimicrobiia bacterium]
MDHAGRREVLESLLAAALSAVDPEPLTRRALASHPSDATLVAIGKAAIAMSRGAADALGRIEGVCVTNHEAPVPDGVDLVLGDHPIPGENSFRAGRAVIEAVTRAEKPIIALVSGGGSSLCEHPIEGVPEMFIRQTTRRLLDDGASIDEINQVRRHLSAIKGGGLARMARVPITTLVISDVCGADASVIASGPTVEQPHDPEAAIAVLSRHDIGVPGEIRDAIFHRRAGRPVETRVTVLADGHTAAKALASSARQSGFTATVQDSWLHGDASTCLDTFLESAGNGLTIATGEPEVTVRGKGVGGRNTHSALLAAKRIAGSPAMFAAFATDGEDGNSTAAGAIVDGGTIVRGGDPDPALIDSDSGSYLQRTGDLLVTGPTGTNVSDLWVLWR